MLRKLSFFIVLMMGAIFLVKGTPAPSAAMADGGGSLIAVSIGSAVDSEGFKASHLPLYAHLSGASHTYFISEADTDDLGKLADLGLSYQILDSDPGAGNYYIAYLMPGQPQPDWRRFGRLLLEDGFFILRGEPAQISLLPDYGVEISSLTLSPKPYPSDTPGLDLPATIVPDPVIQTMIDQVDSVTVNDYTGGLSGEWPVMIGGDPYTIATRNTYSGEPIEKAVQYTGEHLDDLGLSVEYHQWGGSTYPNVIGERTGLVNPDDIFIISAHLDDMPTGPLAPGADDNASGSTAVLIAADILTQYQWGCTLRFALWTGEEQGLLGSEAYAQRAYNNGENILGVLNLDMIAWNTPLSSRDIDLHANSGLPQTLTFAQLFSDVVDAYNLDLIPEIVPNGSGASDHASFWQYGYNAILGIEDFGDFNPNYHTTQDQLENLDLSYFTDFVKASVGTFAHVSDCLIPTGLGYLDGYVSAEDGGSPIEGAIVLAQDNEGHSYPTVTDSSGYYTNTLLTNTYTVTTSAFGYLPNSIGGVEIFSDTTTSLDFYLLTAPEYVVSGTVTEAGTGTPLLAQVSALEAPLPPVWTDPGTGFYTLTLPEGMYTLSVTAEGHRPQERVIQVDQNQTQDFALEPLPCLLLVDDDNNAPDVLPFYTAALDSLGYEYDVFDVGGGVGNGPDLEDMMGYGQVIWFSGDKYGDSAGPNGIDETNLAAYLDSGGRFFLSSQDYLYDFGLTPFGQSYLGVGSFVNDSGGASIKYGVSGDPIGDGLGPYALTYPAGFTDYGDVINPAVGASTAFRSSPSGGNPLDIDKDGGAWKSVFFGTSWVPVYNADPANGEELVARILDWLGGCQVTPSAIWEKAIWIGDSGPFSPAEGPFGVATDEAVTIADRVSIAASGVVTFTLSEPWISALDLTGWETGSGNVITDTNGIVWSVEGALPGVWQTITKTYQVSADNWITGTLENILWVDGADPQPDPVEVGFEHLLPEILVSPMSIEAHTKPGSIVTGTLMIENTGDADLEWYLPDGSPGGWLMIDPESGTILPGEGQTLVLTFDPEGIDPGGSAGTMLAIDSNDPVAPTVQVLVALYVDPWWIHLPLIRR